MPFTQVEDQPRLDAAFLARHRSSAAHPSARKQPRVVNIFRPYHQLPAPAGAVYPRATIRPMPFIDGSGHGFAARVWLAPQHPATKPGGVRWVSENFRTLPEAMDWAAAVVGKLREEDRRSGPWGAAC